MARKKKLSGKSVAAISLAAFLAIGALGSNDDDTKNKADTPPAIVQTQQESPEDTQQDTINNSKSTYNPDTPVANKANNSQTATPSKSTNSTSTVDKSAPSSNKDTEKNTDPQKEPEKQQESKPEKEPEKEPQKDSKGKQSQPKYVGSAESDKYHSPTCRHAKKIIDENLIYFENEDEAVAAGYKPCGTCKP